MLKFLKRFMKILFWWIVVLIIIFIVSEIFFRIFRKESNPLGDVSQKQAEYLFPPNHPFDSQSSVKGEFAYHVNINHYGYRGKDFEMPKPPGVLRIFAVGDSFTFGVGAEENETFAALIEEKLKAKGLPVEIINAGIGHASPIAHYVNLRDIHLKYQPDVVVLFFDLTDLADDWRTERNAIYDPTGEIIRFDPEYMYGRHDWWITMVNHSSFCRYIHNKMVRTVEKIRILGFKEYMTLAMQGKKAKAAIATSQKINANMDTIEYDGMLLARGREKEAHIRKHWPRTEMYLNKIKTMLDQRGIPMIIVTYPHGIFVGAEEWTEGRKAWGFEQHKLYTDRLGFDIVEDYARRNGIPYVGTLDDFLKAPPAKYFFTWDGHMAPPGNHIVAQSVFESKAFEDLIKRKISEMGNGK